MPNNDALERRASPVSLTPMQHRFMLALQARLEGNSGIGPTYEELMQDLGLNSKSGVARIVEECIERGRIAKIPNRVRSLMVIHPVSEDEIKSIDLLSSFSDRELICEVQKRGLVSFSQGAF